MEKASYKTNSETKLETKSRKKTIQELSEIEND